MRPATVAQRSAPTVARPCETGALLPCPLSPPPHHHSDSSAVVLVGVRDAIFELGQAQLNQSQSEMRRGMG